MSTAFLFPGQGSQTVGMGADLFGQFPDEVVEANEILGYSLSDLCVNGPDEQLGQTQYTQPALYLVSYLHARSISSDTEKPAMAAGHSVPHAHVQAAALIPHDRQASRASVLPVQLQPQCGLPWRPFGNVWRSREPSRPPSPSLLHMMYAVYSQCK